jgi:hypothetical protein
MEIARVDNVEHMEIPVEHIEMAWIDTCTCRGYVDGLG